MFDLKVLIFSLIGPLIVGIGLNIFLQNREHTTVLEVVVMVVYIQHFLVASLIGYAASFVRIDISKYSSGGSGGFLPLPVFLPIMALVFLLDYLIVSAAVYFAVIQFIPNQS